MSLSFNSALDWFKHQRKIYLNLSIFDKVVLYAFWVIAIFMILYIYWVEIDSQPAVEFKDVNQNVGFVLPGDVIIIDREFCIKRERPSVLKRRIVDTIIFEMPDINPLLNDYDAFPKGSCHDVRYALKIPKLPAGQDYQYETSLLTELNPYKTIETPIQPAIFFIVSENNPEQMKLREEYLAWVDSTVNAMDKPLYVASATEYEIIVVTNPDELRKTQDPVEQVISQSTEKRDLVDILPHNDDPGVDNRTGPPE